MTDQKPAIQFGSVNPHADSEVQPIELRTDSRTKLDPQQVELIYDRPSDTLHCLLFGRERTSVVAGGHDSLSYLADPETGELLGFQIEDFFAYAAAANPRLLEAVDIAVPRGITRDQVRNERHKRLGDGGRLRAWCHRLALRIQNRTRSRRQAVVRELMSDAMGRFPVRSVALPN